MDRAAAGDGVTQMIFALIGLSNLIPLVALLVCGE